MHDVVKKKKTLINDLAFRKLQKYILRTDGWIEYNSI